MVEFLCKMSKFFHVFAIFIEQYNAMRCQLKIIDTYNAQLFHSDNVKMDYYISVFALSHTIFIGIQCGFCYQKMKIPNIFLIFALLSPSPSASPSLSFSSFMEAQKINKVQLLKRTWKPLDLQLWECNMSRFPISWQPTLPNSPVELLSLRLIALHS